MRVALVKILCNPLCLHPDPAPLVLQGLFNAIAEGQEEMVKYLLQRGANAFVQDADLLGNDCSCMLSLQGVDHERSNASAEPTST